MKRVWGKEFLIEKKRGKTRFKKCYHDSRGWIVEEKTNRKIKREKIKGQKTNL